MSKKIKSKKNSRKLTVICVNYKKFEYDYFYNISLKNKSKPIKKTNSCNEIMKK